MRVLVVSMWPSSDAPERGIFVRGQVDALRDLGTDVDVAPLTDMRSGPWATPRKYIALAKTARRMIRAIRPDLVHGHFLLPTGVIARSVARRARLPYVVTAHGTDVRNAEGSRAIRDRTEPVVRDAAAVVAVSESLAGRLRDLYPGLEPVVADMGIDTALYRPPLARVPGIAGEPRVIAVGSLLPNKNHATLLRAFAALAGGTLTIVGEGPDHLALREAAASLGIADRVRFTGRVPSTELVTMYAESDVATLISHDEGFGLAALEALACGVPTVVSSAAPVSQLVTPNVLGEVVDPRDAAAIAVAIGRAGSLRITDAAAGRIVAGRSTRDRAVEIATLYSGIAIQPVPPR